VVALKVGPDLDEVFAMTRMIPVQGLALMHVSQHSFGHLQASSPSILMLAVSMTLSALSNSDIIK
jgi:hypothetical protein